MHINSNTPAISVVMPVYNGEYFLPTSIESILSQSFRDFEFLIIDDGSLDNTPNIIASYSDPRIRVFRNAQNKGNYNARNKGLMEAKGKYICIMDSDDRALE